MFAALLAALASAAVAADVAGPDQYLDADGVKIRFVDRGKGEPVVLLHGFTMSLDSAWLAPRGESSQASILESLSAAGFRVIAIDARGHGKSDKPHDCDRYGAALADDVLRVMDALGVRRAHLIGFSMGGTTAAQLVARHPDRFRGVVLLAPKVELVEALADGRDPGMDDIARSLDAGQGLTPLFRALTPPGAPPLTDEQLAAQNQRILQGQDPAALACAARGLSRLAIQGKELEALRLPTLVVVGSNDPLLAGAKEVVRRVPASKLQVVEGVTHLTLLGSPRLVPALQAFLVSAGP
jgi:pimeloyl-ACP methyl ester carboxylesterase